MIEKIASALGNRCGGIITREMREQGARTGFSIESLDGERGVLASRNGRRGPKVGRYTVHVQNLERVGMAALRRVMDAGRVVILDEIGKMELISPGFRAMILEALESRLPVVATMGVSRNAFMEVVRARPDVDVLNITTENRDSLKDRVVETIEEALRDEFPEGRA